MSFQSLIGINVSCNLFSYNQQTIVVHDNVDPVGLDEILLAIKRDAAISAAARKVNYRPGILDKLIDAAQLGVEVTNTLLLRDIKQSLGIMTEKEIKDWTEDAEKAYKISEGNTEAERIPATATTFYGNKKPASIKNTTKKSRKKRTTSDTSGQGFGR